MPYKLEYDLKNIEERKKQLEEERNSSLAEIYEAQNLNDESKPFAYGICAEKLFWLFIIASVLGFVFETFWSFITMGRFEMRTSLVIGMFIPVYGLGAIAMTLCLRRFYRKSDILIFIGSAVIGGTVEFLCSLMQELAFGTVSWNYSNTQFNLAGRTNLGFALIWGILGVIWIKNWYPLLSRTIERMPKKAGRYMTALLAVVITLDIALSSAAVIRKVERHYQKPAVNVFDVVLDSCFTDAYLDFVYPHMEIPQESK